MPRGELDEQELPLHVEARTARAATAENTSAISAAAAAALRLSLSPRRWRRTASVSVATGDASTSLRRSPEDVSAQTIFVESEGLGGEARLHAAGVSLAESTPVQRTAVAVQTPMTHIAAHRHLSEGLFSSEPRWGRRRLRRRTRVVPTRG